MLRNAAIAMGLFATVGVLFSVAPPTAGVPLCMSGACAVVPNAGREATEIGTALTPPQAVLAEADMEKSPASHPAATACTPDCDSAPVLFLASELDERWCDLPWDPAPPPLDREVSVHVDNQPLRVLFESIAREGGIDILVDPAVLRAAMTVEPITMNVDGIRLRSVLNLALEPFHFSYSIDPGSGIFRIVQSQGELIERRYPVGDLAFTGTGDSRRFAPEPLVNMLWDQTGYRYGRIVSGSGMPRAPADGPIQVDFHNEALNIRYAPHQHREVARMLAWMRGVKRRHSPSTEIDWPKLDVLLLLSSGYLPPQRLQKNVLTVHCGFESGWSVGERSFASADELIEFLGGQPQEALRSGILYMPHGFGYSSVDLDTCELLESFCRTADVDLFLGCYFVRDDMVPSWKVKASSSIYSNEP